MKKLVPLVIACLIIVYVSLGNRKKKYQRFFVDLVCDPPYRFGIYLGIALISMKNVVWGFLALIPYLIMDNDVSWVVGISTRDAQSTQGA